MGLIDLQSDLTSLKYGAKLPAVRHEMGNKVSRASARTDDVKRIGVILTRAPGRRFAANQSLLATAKIGSAIDGKFKDGGTVAGAVLAGVGAAFKATVGQGLFLTANAAKAGTGFHSINPIVAKSYLKEGEKEKKEPKTKLGKFIQGAAEAIDKVQQAIGAKSAAYHVGKLVLGGASDIGPIQPTDGEIYKRGVEEGEDNQGKTSFSYKSVKVDQSGKVTKEDSRSKGLGRFLINSPDNGRVDIDDVAYLPLKSENLNHGGKDLPYYYESGSGDEIQKKDVLKEALGADEQDILPFVFNFYTPGEGKDGTDSFLYFRALLDNLSDNYSAQWNGIKYIGRAEEFFTYTGFGRTISFGFKAAAFSKEELVPIYNKLNHLVGSTAPTYGDEGLFMRGTLLKLTIGDYIKEQNGFLTSVILSWNTDYPWEIGDDLKVPHLLDVSCEFTTIHSFNPEFGKDEKKFLGAG